MYTTGTLLINPATNKVNGFIHRILAPEESGTQSPFLLTNSEGTVTGITHLNPIKVITGYQYYSELLYKTYDPETNSFV